MQKITPFLWFNDNAEEAMNYYCSVFRDAKPGGLMRWPKGGPEPEGKVLTASFELFGQRFTALNGGPHFRFTEAVSFVVNCKDQEETDYYWDKLIADGGQPSQCGWLKDKLGLSWQIVPDGFLKLMNTGDADQRSRTMQAMMKMTKLDVGVLEKAWKGE